MSGIDTSIYNNLLRTPKTVAELDAEAMQGQQNRLLLQSTRMKMDEQQRGVERGNKLTNMLGSFAPGMSAADQGDTLTRGGFIDEGRKVIESGAKVNKDQREGDKAQREAEKFQDDKQLAHYTFMNQVISSAVDPASYAQGLAAMQSRGIDISQIPQQFDPAYVRNAGAQTVTELQRITRAMEERKQGEVERNNKAQTATTQRGQNMTASTAAVGRKQAARQHDDSRADSLSKPFEVTGPDGTPILVQQSKAGIVPVEGYSPKRAMQKPVPPGVVKTLTEARDNATTMDRLNADFKPEYGGKGVFGIGADLSMGVKGNTGFDQKSVAFWKDYRKNAELVERHAMFGASLTPGEQASWRSADIAPGMSPAVIKTNLATRAALTKKISAATADDMVDAGHNEGRVRAIAGRGEAKPSATGAYSDAEKERRYQEFKAKQGQK